MQMTIDKLKVVFVALIFIAITRGMAYSQELDWDVFSTEFCTVFCERGVDLRALDRRINLKFSNFYSPRGPAFREYSSTEDSLGIKLDSIFNKVRESLDMYPQRIHVAVKIFKTEERLDEIYRDFFGELNTPKAFYLYKTNTIYTTQDLIDERVLAHEMAHCIIDHYFVILPPDKIREILAAYADVNLNN